MKKLIVLFAMMLAGMSLNAQADAIDSFFKQYIDDPRFTVVFISPRLFSLFDKMDFDDDDFDDDEDEAILRATKGLKGLRILTADDYSNELYDEAIKKINTTDYEILMKVRDRDGSNLDFYIKESAENKISELFLIAGGDRDEFVLISFVGSMNLDDVTKIAKDIEKKNRY